MFAYNRPEVEGSARPGAAQIGSVVVSELRSVLKAANLSPPYILIGHSFGGLFANYFARVHPEEVLGVGLIEASHIDERDAHEENSGLVLRMINGVLSGWDALRGHKHTLSEIDHIEQTANEMAAAPQFPEIPLTVVSAGRKPPFMPRRMFESHAGYQRKLAGLTATAVHIIAKRSGHFPQINEPDLVSNAIRDLVKRAREC
ncbi:MAG: alpha/beta fold hydrolase [Hyphomicrobiaceae bacterium]